MNIGLIDVDGHNFPNIALMKISAWHKARGDSVEWCLPLLHYDIIYQSKVFDETYSHDIEWYPNADKIIKGGTGYFRKPKGKDYYEIYHNGVWENIGHNTEAIRSVFGIECLYSFLLPYDVEHSYPDYGIYPNLTEDTAYGFLTRGCPRGCGFCGVAEKEGRKSYKVADLSEFWRGQKNIVLLDPNILACREHIDLLQQLIDSNAQVDITQGLDIRMLDDFDIDDLNRMKIKRLHFAWDNPKEDLRQKFWSFGVRWRIKDERRKIVYVLTNYDSTHEEDLMRIYTLRDLGYDPDVRIYDKPHAPRETRRLQRGCNTKRIFKSVPDFRDYDPKKG